MEDVKRVVLDYVIKEYVEDDTQELADEEAVLGRLARQQQHVAAGREGEQLLAGAKSAPLDELARELDLRAIADEADDLGRSGGHRSLSNSSFPRGPEAPTRCALESRFPDYRPSTRQRASSV